MKDKIKIAIADDHVIFRDGLVSLLKQADFSSIAFEAGNAHEVFENLKSKPPDILILDIRMPDTSGTETLEKVKELYPDIKVIILSSFYEDSLIIEFIKKGSNAFLPKICGRDLLIKTIESVYQTGFYYSDKIIPLLPKITEKSPNGNIDGLTESERNIIILLCNDLSHQQIADKLHISKRTVDHHRESINKKTNCHTILQLVKYARANNIIPIEFK